MTARLTEAQIEEMRQLRRNGTPVGEIRRTFGVSSTTVSRYTMHLGEPEPQPESLKLRLLQAIAETGPYADVMALCADVRGGPEDQSYGPHEVTHLLWSLSKSGYITFRENKRGPGRGSLLEHIEATPTGAGRAFAQHAPPQEPEVDAESHKPRTNGEAPETLELTVGPPARWPELESLKLRLESAIETLRHATALMQAADLLEALDPDEALRLMGRADELTAGVGFTPVEREYLSFAEEQEVDT